ncbi:hypothetical protein FIBSPDRAFT_256988 [Athelia psychrophila]|uniref:Uncharacterized protein n=1 Tax=Athelia psychrophila TaxID=1759441 RepID=A0A165XK37_9AGAM|nr:hypothetical protein FIBSPDRAFT_256988 [Fibularhizoctonia sp. CBS 109695]
MHMSVVWSPEQSPAPLRRSPSLESIPSSVMPATEPYRSNMGDIPASTSMENIGGLSMTSTSDRVSPQNDAPLVQVDWIEGEFKAWLNERAAAREAKAKVDEPPPPPVLSCPANDAPYMKHQRYCFPADNIHFLVRI